MNGYSSERERRPPSEQVSSNALPDEMKVEFVISFRVKNQTVDVLIFLVYFIKVIFLFNSFSF